MTTQKCIKNRSSLYHHHHCYFWYCHCRNHYSDHHKSFVFTCGITSINSIAANNNTTVTIIITTTDTPTNSSLITTYYYCHHNHNHQHQQHNYSIILYHQHHRPHQRPLGWTMSMRLSTSRVIRPSSHALDSCNQLTNQSYLLRRIMCWSPTGKSESSDDLISFKVKLILDIALIVQSKVRYYNHCHHHHHHHHHPHHHYHLNNNEL